MEDKKAQEKIAEYLVNSNLPDHGKDAKWKAYRILRIIGRLGYHKLPKDKPPSLGNNDWETINRKAGIDVIDIVVNLDGRYTLVQQAELIVDRCNLFAQAQRELCIKHYKEVKGDNTGN